MQIRVFILFTLTLTLCAQTNPDTQTKGSRPQSSRQKATEPAPAGTPAPLSTPTPAPASTPANAPNPAPVPAAADLTSDSPAPSLVPYPLKGLCHDTGTLQDVAIKCKDNQNPQQGNDAAAIVANYQPANFQLRSSQANLITIVCKSSCTLADLTQVEKDIDARTLVVNPAPPKPVTPVGQAKQFCLSGTLNGPYVPYTPGLCDPPLRVPDSGNGKPSPAYIEDRPVPSGAASEVASAINRANSLGITADAVGRDLVRLKSATPVAPGDVEAVFSSFLVNPEPFLVALREFCLSGNLQEGFKPYTPNGCRAPLRVPASRDFLQTALKGNPDFSVADGSDDQILVTCTSPGNCVPQWIRERIRAAERPSPGYIQDIELPNPSAAATAAAAIAKAKPLGVTADAIGTKVRLKSDEPVAADDLAALFDGYLYGGSAPPLIRMFYQLPGVVVAPAIPPAGASASTGGNANAAGGNPGGSATPNPAAGGQQSASPSATGANSVTFTVKSGDSSDGQTPAGGSPAPASGNPNTAVVINQSTAGGQPGKAQQPATQKGSAPQPPKGGATDGQAGTPPPAQPTQPNQNVAKTPASSSESTTTSVTITPPAPSQPSSPPAPSPVLKDMVGVNDNVVFNDTSDDKLVWQRSRLIALLDLPRPEVIMNVWSYQASSPDSREILHSSERVRDLVSAENDALQNSIQFGWAYLSREMSHRSTCWDNCDNRFSAGWPAQQSVPPSDKGGLPFSDPLALFPPILGATSRTQVDETRLAALKDQFDRASRTFHSERDGLGPAVDWLADIGIAIAGLNAIQGSPFAAEIAALQGSKLQMAGAPNEGDESLDRRQLAALASAAAIASRLVSDVRVRDRASLVALDALSKRKLNADAALDALKELEAIGNALGNQPQHVVFPFFEPHFYNYITQKFLSDDLPALGPQLSSKAREEWGFCKRGEYCLGYADAFQPVRPNLTSVLLGAIASKTPLRTMLTTIGCMEGKYEVYPECFPFRFNVDQLIAGAKVLRETQSKQYSRTKKLGSDIPCSGCTELYTELKALRDADIKAAANGQNAPGTKAPANDPNALVRACLRGQRSKIIKERPYAGSMSCETLDGVALEAQERCGVPQSLPLSCFTLQAGQSFSSNTDFSTFTLSQLNELAEVRLADGVREDEPRYYTSSRVGLLRAAIADFLFNYKMSQEFPKDFSSYELQHSAQELNAELNPLVVAFNQDVAAFSRRMSDILQTGTPTQTSFVQLWRNHKSFVSDGIITIRGIGGDQSSVQTQTNSYFKATRPRALSDVLTTINGGNAGSPASAVVTALTNGTLTPAAALSALSALTPQSMTAQISSQLNFTVTPFTLPGASSAELQVSLTAGDSAPPAVYASGSTTSSADPISHVANLSVSTRVRVESVKMFELSSFSALIQRPQSKLPLVPPFIELPWIGNLASVPMPGERQYHRSTAIVSAVLVPTATDLAYGLEFARDRQLTPNLPGQTPDDRNYRLESVLSLAVFKNLPIQAFHRATVNCLATLDVVAFPGGYKGGCDAMTFEKIPREF